jgi:hypothetical protein
MHLPFRIYDLRLSFARLAVRLCCFLMFSLFACAGCGTPAQTEASPVPQTPGERPRVVEQPLSPVPAGFGPARISILPLSEITHPVATGQGDTLTVYVAVLDAFGCPMKAPCTLRFEVYEYVRRSAQPKGQRLMTWQDVDLTHPAENHRYWRDFLRAYEFQFELRVDRDQTYILEATCLSSDGRRLSAECAVRAGQ